ncbi:phosphatase PAP2 family protein [Mycolicibacterium sp. CBM1]
MGSRKAWLIGSALAAAMVYAAMWVGFVQHWGWLAAVDTVLLREFRDIGAARPGWVKFWVVFCFVFGPIGFRVIALVMIIAALTRRHLQTALFLVISVELMGLVTEAAKLLANRQRPDTALSHATSTSFPSGHALGVMVGVLAVLTVIWPRLARAARLPLAVLGAALIVVVGSARVVLNVHHPSDVVAGWALGYLYYLLCMRLLPPRQVTAAAGKPAELDSVH